MGALVNAQQRADVQENEHIAPAVRDWPGGQADLSAAGAFFRPTFLYVRSRMKHRRYMQQKPLALSQR